MQSNDKVYEFLKLLVEFGGVHYVNEDKYVCNVSDDKPVLININNKGMPLMVFHNNMAPGEHTIFNPLIEQLGPSSERAWFFQRNSLIIGNMVKTLIRKAAELSQHPEKCYDKLDLIEPYFAAMDKKFLNELEKLKPSDIMRIFYHKKRKIAQLQTEVFDDDHFKSISKSFRKRSRDAIRGLVSEFMGTDDISKVFQHKASHIGMQEADASIHVLVKAAEALHQYASLLLDKDLKVAELSLHLESLEKYHKQCIWFANASTQKASKAETVIEDRPPWEDPLPNTGSVLPGSQSTLPRNVRSAADAAVQVPMMPQLGQVMMPQSTGMPVMAPQQQAPMQMSATGLPVNVHAPGTMQSNQFGQPMGQMAPQMQMMPQGISPFGAPQNSPYASPLGAPTSQHSNLVPNRLTPRSNANPASKLPAPKI